MTASLYIHIPFCAHKCDYCDFYSIPLTKNDNADLLDTFIGALLADIKEQLLFFHVDDVPTVYIGGGTPSALGATRVERLLAGVQTLLEPMKKPPFEFTIEANPESADDDFFNVCAGSRACASGGVNRISMGVQTFNEASRRTVHRAGGGTLLEQRLAAAAAHFPGALSVDLITGLPFHSNEMVTRDIERVLAFQPAHVSLYSLTIEPNTPLGARAEQQGAAVLSLPCGDDADNLWIAGRDRLEQAGLAQYEVSNFSVPGKTCAHNIRYWRMENWLGAGPAASGTIIDDDTGTAQRYTYPADINAYLGAHQIHGARVEAIDRAGLIRETLLMGFRYRAGPDPLMFRRRFGCSIEDCIPHTIARWRARGFFADEQHGSPAVDSLSVSHNGLLFLNGFLRDAFGEYSAYC